MPELNLDKLRKQNQKANERSKVIYRKVLEDVHRRINTASEQELTSVVYRFRQFNLGVPLYDVERCRRYVAKKLKSKGLKVQKQDSDELKISWEGI